MATAALMVGLLGAATGMAQDDPGWAQFGVAVAIVPDTIFVAASPMKDGARAPGAVHVFERRQSRWVRAGVLSAPEARTEDLFGVSMAAADDTLVVGAQFADARGEDSGLAYVFERRGTAWHPAAVLSASDAAPGDQFGLTVSVSGDTIAVGARLSDKRLNNAGAAYLFARRDGRWEEVGKVTASDAAAGDIFGRVALDRERLVVSADLSDDQGNNSGKAYVFENRQGAWVEDAILLADDGAAGDELGVSLVLKGRTAVLGAVASDGRVRDTGAAYVFELTDDKWVQRAKLSPSDGAAKQWFGFSVAAGTDVIVVGAPNDGGKGEGAGAAYVFHRNAGAWTHGGKLTADNATRRMWFGNTVAISGSTIVVGMLRNGDGRRSGAAYVFERRRGGWSQVARLNPTLADDRKH